MQFVHVKEARFPHTSQSGSAFGGGRTDAADARAGADAEASGKGGVGGVGGAEEVFPPFLFVIFVMGVGGGGWLGVFANTVRSVANGSIAFVRRPALGRRPCQSDDAGSVSTPGPGRAACRPCPLPLRRSLPLPPLSAPLLDRLQVDVRFVQGVSQAYLAQNRFPQPLHVQDPGPPRRPRGVLQPLSSGTH